MCIVSLFGVTVGITQRSSSDPEVTPERVKIQIFICLLLLLPLLLLLDYYYSIPFNSTRNVVHHHPNFKAFEAFKNLVSN